MVSVTCSSICGVISLHRFASFRLLQLFLVSPGL